MISAFGVDHGEVSKGLMSGLGSAGGLKKLDLNKPKSPTSQSKPTGTANLMARPPKPPGASVQQPLRPGATRMPSSFNQQATTPKPPQNRPPGQLR